MLQPPDDGSLLSDFRDTRSESAFTELVRRHLPLVFQVALRRLGSAALAQEAAQNAFTRLAAKAAAVARHPERLRAWLHRTTYFEASTLARKESRLSKLPVIPDPEPMNRPEIYDRLDEALNRLPELDRELVLRHCCGGEDYRQMAGAVGKSEAACQKRVERALARLARGMSGARTTGAVVAAFAASSAKLPAAERIAAAALRQHAAAGGVAGAVGGAKVAACAALILAGGAAGWPPRPAEVTSPPSLASTPASAPVEGNVAATANDVALSPRPVRTDRSLDEVLESILAGRLAPLVEYLPQATVADLRAIMAEDDIGELSEGMGSFGTAHDLAARRWVEIEPAAALAYGLSRSPSLATGMLARWIETDPRGAADAYLALPRVDRHSLAEIMVQTNDEVAGQLAAIDPSTAWVVEEQRRLYPDPAMMEQDAERLIAGLLEGKQRDEPDASEVADIQSAFWRLAQRDRETTVERAGLIPWPALRAEMLAALGQPPASDSLPPGEIRTQAVGLETEQLVKTDPEAAIRRLQSAAPGAERDAMYAAISSSLEGSDPWHLLELASSLKGPLKNFNLGPALTHAGKHDPERGLAMLPGIAARFDTYNGIQGPAQDLLAGWIEKDTVAAMRWAAEAGIWLDPDDFAKSTASAEALLPLITDPDGSVRAMARGAIHRHLEERLANGSAKSLLDRIPPDVTDGLLKWIAADASGRGSFGDAMAIAAMASAEAREQEILPQMGFRAFRQDSATAVAWVKSLSSEDRRIVIDGVQRIISDPQFGGGDDVKIREALQQVEP